MSDILDFMKEDDRFRQAQEDPGGRRWWHGKTYIVFKHAFGGWHIWANKEAVEFGDDIEKFKTYFNL